MNGPRTAATEFPGPARRRDGLDGRPGSGGYYAGSLMLYIGFGTGFQTALGWLICRIGYAAGLTDLETGNERTHAPMS